MLNTSGNKKTNNYNDNSNNYSPRNSSYKYNNDSTSKNFSSPRNNSQTQNDNSKESTKHDSSRHESSKDDNDLKQTGGNNNDKETNKNEQNNKNNNRDNNENKNNDTNQDKSKNNFFGGQPVSNGVLNLTRNIDTSEKYRSSILNSNKIKNFSGLNNYNTNNNFPNTYSNPNINNMQGGNLFTGDGDRNRIEWNEEQNQYIIYENGNTDCIFTNDDILYYIINPELGKLCIKKYIFIISNNPMLNVYEFNFVNSVFTNHLDYMV